MGKSREEQLMCKAQKLVEKSEHRFSFVEKASVFESGDGMYTVIWTTNRSASGYITYTYEGKNYKVSDQFCGNIRCDDTIHSVRVPKKHLDSNSYTYHSQLVGIKLDYSAVKGKTISSAPVFFKGYDGGSSVNVLVLSDIHGNPAPAEKAASHFESKPDLLVLNGDISGTMIFKKNFTERVLRYAYLFSHGEIPVAYTRGNHETRGAFADKLSSYFKTDFGGLCFDFDYGPLHSTVLDTGEDKEDSHVEYSGLVDFNAYIASVTEWLAARPLPGKKAKWNIAFAHIPYIDKRYGNNWCPLLERLGVNALISGHTHTFELDPKGCEGFPFRVLLEGGTTDYSKGFVATMLSFSKKGKMDITAFNAAGDTICKETIDI